MGGGLGHVQGSQVIRSWRVPLDALLQKRVPLQRLYLPIFLSCMVAVMKHDARLNSKKSPF